jgi:SAM-dependent methyltransferase
LPDRTDDARAGEESGYDALASRTDRDGWESPWGDNPLQAHYSWPATQSLLPDLDGERVLDAGCGVGDHVEWLLEQGASVVGVDASERAVETARERVGDAEDPAGAATFRHADLTDPLPFDDARFDVVLSHLVLDHLEDLAPAFAEFHRVSAAGGTLAFTVVHPVQYYLAYDAVDRYYDVTPVEVSWDPPVTSYHRPTADVVQPLVDAGFRIERFEEPEPPAEYVERAAEEWHVDERPQVLCVRARAAGERQ